jgi:hypothetical protein
MVTENTQDNQNSGVQVQFLADHVDECQACQAWLTEIHTRVNGRAFFLCIRNGTCLWCFVGTVCVGYCVNGGEGLLPGSIGVKAVTDGSEVKSGHGCTRIRAHQKKS